MGNEFGEMRKSGGEAEPEECDLAVQNEAEVAVVEFKLAMPKALRGYGRGPKLRSERAHV